MLKLFDSVELLEDVYDEDFVDGALLRRGFRGAIVDVYLAPHEAYAVEVFDADGRTIGLVTLQPHQVRRIDGEQP